MSMQQPNHHHQSNPMSTKPVLFTLIATKASQQASQTTQYAQTRYQYSNSASAPSAQSRRFVDCIKIEKGKEATGQASCCKAVHFPATVSLLPLAVPGDLKPNHSRHLKDPHSVPIRPPACSALDPHPLYTLCIFRLIIQRHEAMLNLTSTIDQLRKIAASFSINEQLSSSKYLRS
ncbi:hypothetical protein BKA80DRAFT_280923 [Phyllosticta citrichinensis]